MSAICWASAPLVPKNARQILMLAFQEGTGEVMRWPLPERLGWIVHN